MKPEFRVKVFHKGAEFSFNGGPKQKAEMFPPIVEAWVPVAECESVLFKVGRREFAVTIERVRKVKKNGRS
jgi:hypothetical protein